MIKGWTNGRYTPAPGATAQTDPYYEYRSTPKTMTTLGDVHEVFGGGNNADVVGSTTVNIGTAANVTVHETNQTSTRTFEGANISGNVYGGGNNAAVTGQTHINVGPAR